LALAQHLACIHCSAQSSDSPLKRIHKILDAREDSRDAQQRATQEPL